MSVSPADIAALTTGDSTMGYSFFLGIGIGAEYPCGSVAASEQSEEEGIAKNAQNRWFALATSENATGAMNSRYLRYFPQIQ